MKPATMAPVYAVLYARMAEAARTCGYALAVHGTMGRDLDLVAIPWVDGAKSADEVVRAMAEVAARRVGGDLVIGYQPDETPRPHGRVGYSFPFVSTDGFTPDGYVDVSVMPRSTGHRSPLTREDEEEISAAVASARREGEESGRRAWHREGYMLAVDCAVGMVRYHCDCTHTDVPGLVELLKDDPTFGYKGLDTLPPSAPSPGIGDQDKETVCTCTRVSGDSPTCVFHGGHRVEP